MSGKSYLCTFSAGYLSGLTSELFGAYQEGKFTSEGLTHPSVKDNCIISGTQQAAEDFVKVQMKKYPRLNELSLKNPLLFGACTGLPMWALTQIVATPLQNRHDSKKGPYTGYFRNVATDVAYHTIKNGLDEYFNARVFPVLLPKAGEFATQKIVEASITGLVAGGSYVFSWPFRSVLAGQSALDAFHKCAKTIPRAAIKKATYTLARPKFVALIK